MTVNIVFKNNGQGLSRDAKILAGILADGGHDVSLSPQPIRAPFQLRFIPEQATWAITTARSAARRWQRARSSKWDVNIFIEGIVEPYQRLARVNFFLPHQEWLTEADRKLMRTVDLVLFKTRHAQQHLASDAAQSTFIGFTSQDRRRQGLATDWNRGLHVAGWNPYKGTPMLLSTWRAHPHWPSIQVIAQTAEETPAPNITLVTRRVSDDELITLQNQSGLHLCPSEVEGFGHSINEARSCGAVIVTTNAPPMNELVTADSGVLVPFGKTVPMASGTRFKITRDGLIEAIDRWTHMSVEERVRRGTAARMAWEEGDRQFRASLLALVAKC